MHKETVYLKLYIQLICIQSGYKVSILRFCFAASTVVVLKQVLPQAIYVYLIFFSPKKIIHVSAMQNFFL